MLLDIPKIHINEVASFSYITLVSYNPFENCIFKLDLYNENREFIKSVDIKIASSKINDVIREEILSKNVNSISLSI